MITTIQIIVLVFVVFAASRVILRAKDKKISVTELFFWLAVWAGLTGVVFFPELTAPAAAFLGVGRGIEHRAAVLSHIQALCENRRAAAGRNRCCKEGSNRQEEKEVIAFFETIIF